MGGDYARCSRWWSEVDGDRGGDCQRWSKMLVVATSGWVDEGGQR